MNRFFSKNELTLIILLIMLFDLNSFCDISLKHIVYTNNRMFLTFFMGLTFLLLDIFIYHTITNTTPMPEVVFQPNSSRDQPTTCEASVQKQVAQYNDAINKSKTLCTNPQSNQFAIISEKVVINFVATVFVAIVISALAMKMTPEMNPRLTRLALSVPLILIMLALVVWVNAFVPLQ